MFKTNYRKENGCVLEEKTLLGFTYSTDIWWRSVYTQSIGGLPVEMPKWSNFKETISPPNKKVEYLENAL